MLSKSLMAGALCAAALTLTGCTDERTSAAPKMTSAELESAINSRISSDPALKNVDIDADAEDNEVTLTGTVETQEQRTRVTDAVKAVNATLQVTDKIDVKPREILRSEYTEDMAREAREKAKGFGEKIGSSLDDAWIHSKITAKLVTDKDTPARKINVDVDNNVVTLRGTVESDAAKSEAGRIAQETDGVKRVVNLLKVG